jgi:hypothetical protein
VRTRGSIVVSFSCVRRHLAETLEAADLDLAAAGELGLDELVLVCVVARIERLAALGELVERRHGEEQVPFRIRSGISDRRR